MSLHKNFSGHDCWKNVSYGTCFPYICKCKACWRQFFLFSQCNNRSKWKRGGVPTIGDKVTFCCGSSALGNITIGNNVTIGASTLILNDVPDNCTVVGNPAVIVKLKGEKMRILLKDYKAQ